MHVFAEARGVALSLENPTLGVALPAIDTFRSDILTSFDGSIDAITECLVACSYTMLAELMRVSRHFIASPSARFNEIAPMLSHVMHCSSVLVIGGGRKGVNERSRRAIIAMAPQLPAMVTPASNATAALTMVKWGVNTSGM